jgi:DNA invertase Pin-like site-specific DNA recombinase
MPNRQIDEVLEAQALTLAYGGFPVEKVSRTTGIHRSTLDRLKKKAGAGAITRPKSLSLSLNTSLTNLVPDARQKSQRSKS